MKGYYTIPRLINRYKTYATYTSPLRAIYRLLSYSAIPKNMRQRIADLLQLELVKLKLL